MYVDPFVFCEALASLITNAVRFSKPGATIQVGLAVHDEPGGRVLWLKVRDHAQFAAEGRVAEELFQDLGDGVGLGLSYLASRRMVELHGGRVEVSLPEDGGTCVVVTLPLHRAA